MAKNLTFWRQLPCSQTRTITTQETHCAANVNVLASRLTKIPKTGRRRSALLLDIKTAFLNAFCRRNIFMELPEEDPLSADGRYVGKLERASLDMRLRYLISNW